jgi:hypothetical protein
VSSRQDSAVAVAVTESLDRVADVVRRAVSRLAELQKQLPSIPTSQLIAGYVALHPYTKAIDSFMSAVRDELVGDSTPEPSGRVFTESGEDLSVWFDTAGNVHAAVERDGATAEVSVVRRVRSTLNPDRAREVLAREGLLNEGCRVEFVVTDHAAMEKALQDLASGSADFGAVLRLLERRYEPDESKIENLVREGRLATDIAVEMFDTKASWALTVPKKKG